MAVQFTPLPTHVFAPEQQPYIDRLNRELRDIFALEGVLRNPASIRRSDATVVRRSEVQVDVSRITPSLSGIVSGSSTVVGVPALTLGTINAAGSTTTAIATNSSVAVFGTQIPQGFSTAASVGSSAYAMRADARFRYPEALAPLSDGSKTVTLTDDGSLGSLFTAAGTFSANAMSLQAPNATNPLTIGKYGNLSLGGAASVDQYMQNFTKLDFAESSVGPVGWFASLANSGLGDAGGLVRGLVVTITGSCSTAGDSTTRAINGINVSMTGGAAGNSYFQGTMTGIQVLNANVSASTTSTTVPLIADFRSASSRAYTRTQVNTMLGYEHRGTVSLLTSATLTNQYGFLCQALTAGSTRICFGASAITTGAPAVAYGFHSKLHTVGTVRRSFIGDNSAEVGKYLVFGNTGFGPVFKDTQGTPEYWALTVDSSGTSGCSLRVDASGFLYVAREASATGNLDLLITDVGATAPTT